MSTKLVLISLKPRYAKLVFGGRKKVEFRRRISAEFVRNRRVVIYVSSPVREIRGGFRIGHVWRESPERLWRRVSDVAGVGKGEFDSYFAGSSVAYALQIIGLWGMAPIELDHLRSSLTRFAVPQSWRYVRSEEAVLFKELVFSKQRLHNVWRIADV